MRFPANAATGPGRIYVNNGGDDFGWSEPAAFTIV
jgi:hypothetical protein